jgi:hypothetical protein
MSIALLSAPPEVGASSLPDPYLWASGLVRIFGEARCGRRPWRQLWPLLDLPVITEVWPQRRRPQGHLLHVGKVLGQQPGPGAWELTVLVREELRHRAVALRLEEAARTFDGHLGPPGPRFQPMRRFDPGRPPEVWLATALHLL